MPAKAPLFSTYRQGENRITGSLIAVLQRIDTGHVARLLGAAAGESDLPYVSFTNQAAASTGSVPDAEIRAGFHYLFEVKTVANGVRKDQLEGHLQHLEGPAANQRLFVITPDPGEPGPIGDIGDERVIWFSFRDLDRAIADLLDDPSELISEQEQFLLIELRALFEHEGLLDHRDVVVVAARQAYPEYLATGAYVCQPVARFARESSGSASMPMARSSLSCQGSCTSRTTSSSALPKLPPERTQGTPTGLPSDP